MSERLPPLTALRAFEAASRWMSFAKAAEELNVTPAALSFQIKSLEDHLGAPVFRRLNRAVELTELGALLKPGMEDGFAALNAAWRGALRSLDETHLTITAGPGFTAKWLAPRMFNFASAHPDIELRFSATLRLMDFARDDVDLAIRFGQGHDDELYSKTIIEEWVTPIMAPDLALRVKTLDDLRNLPLLTQDDTSFLTPPINWRSFFETAGLAPPRAGGTRFSQADHAIDAAVAGAGAILGRISMSEGHLRDGSLVSPLPEAMYMNATYRMVCPPGAQARAHVARFIHWVEDQTASLEALKDGKVFLNACPS
ncbi:MAG: transcriptional regulator GcvA [Pseudomonadota bacterium]